MRKSQAVLKISDKQFDTQAQKITYNYSQNLMDIMREMPEYNEIDSEISSENSNSTEHIKQSLQPSQRLNFTIKTPIDIIE